MKINPLYYTEKCLSTFTSNMIKNYYLGLDTADICVILSVLADGTLLNPMLIFKVTIFRH